ncbi:MAG: hypothetical protein WD739_07465 [Actinomycetota bacterium]
MKITGGTFGTYFSVLKREALIEQSGNELTITERGLDFLGVTPAAPPTTRDVLAMYRSRLKAGARRMLDLLVDAYPGWITREELAAAVEMEPTGGTFGTYLGHLRRNGLAEVEDGKVRAGEALFLGGSV